MAATSLETDRDPAPATRVRLMVITMLSLMAAQAYLCRQSIGVIAKVIRLDLGLTETQLGLIMGPAFFWSYGLAQIPSSRLGERFGIRLSLPLFVCAWSIATALFGTCSWFPLLMVIWIVVGLSQAGAFPVAMRTVAGWHPQSERAMASGALAAMMSLGAALCAALTGLLVNWVPWPILFACYAVPGFVWAIVFYVWFRDRPEDHQSVNGSELAVIRGTVTAEAEPGVVREPTPWMSLAASWPMWMICGQQYFRAAAQVFFGSWFTTFLLESRHISLTQSGLLSVLPYLALAAACLIGGGVSDFVFRRTGSLKLARKGLAIASLTLCASLIFSAWYVQDATLAVILISVGTFCSGLASPCAYAVSVDMGGRHVGAVFATMNMFGNIGAGVLPWLVPRFRQGVESSPTLLNL